MPSWAAGARMSGMSSPSSEADPSQDLSAKEQGPHNREPGQQVDHRTLVSAPRVAPVAYSSIPGQHRLRPSLPRAPRPREATGPTDWHTVGLVSLILRRAGGSLPRRRRLLALVRLRRTAFISVLVAAACAAVTSCQSAQDVELQLSPVTSLYDAAFTTTVSGVAPGGQVTLQLSSVDKDGTTWNSSAVFTASDSGQVSTTQAPVSGSYPMANAMGLVETLSPGQDGKVFAAPTPWTMTMSVSVDGAVKASATTTRALITANEARATDERPATSGVYGTLYLPAKASTTPRPAVMVIGGSEGGLSTTVQAATLAAHGYPALALAYFHVPGLPDSLENIPLEYFATAAQLLQKQAGVDPNRIVLLGASRGSEAALLTAANYPELVHAVIAAVPASESFGGLSSSPSAAWTFHGKPLPVGDRSETFDPSPTSPAAIPVEAISGPLLLICGGKDEVWPSCTNVDAIKARLQQHAVTRAPTVLTFPESGHLVGGLVPFLPSTTVTGTTASGIQLNTGGTYQAFQAARAQAWPQVLTFLQALPR